MSDASVLIDGINKKINKLLALHGELKMKYTDAVDKQLELDRTVKDQEELIKKLKEENRNLKIAKSVKLSEENTDIKIKIEELVREIDHCIGLLNK
jgi:hypothetical protein